MARSPVQIVAHTNVGNPIATASVALTQRVGGAAVTHWSAETGGSSDTAALSTDANGRTALRWVDSGSYNAAISKAGFVTVNRAIDAVRGDAVEIIADNTVGSTQFADGSVTAAKLVSNAITTAKLAAVAVTEPKLATDAVSTRTIVNVSVTNAKVADNAVTSVKILDRSIGSAEINAGAVGSAELAAGAVSTAKIVDDAVLSTHIQPMAVTTIKLAANGIQGFNVPDDAVQPEHVHGDVLPIGFMIAFGGANAPSAYWMVANGQAVSRATYAELFAYLGTTFGVGDGSTTFNLPNMQGRSPIGIGTEASVNTTGLNDGVTAANRGPKHGHGVGSVGITSSGTHGHIFTGGGVVANTQCAGAGPDHLVDGNATGGTSGNAAHGHTLSGWQGITGGDFPPGGNDDQVFNQVVQYLIKVL